MNKQFCVLYFLICILCSCRQHTENKKDIIVDTNNRLINFKSELIYTVDDLEKMDNKVLNSITSDKFNRKTDTIKYLAGKIYISYLRATSGCSKYSGDIKFSHDTITLLINNLYDNSCAEQDVWRLTYEIENKKNHNYIITKY